MENLEPKKSKKKLWMYLFLLANITIVILLVFKEFQQDSDISLSDVNDLWAENWKYFIFVIISPIMLLLLESLKYVVMIYKTTGEFHFLLSLKVGILGKYYDNVTPLGSGGQPFQMYYLHKGGVAGGVAGSLPIAGFFFTQLAFLTVCLILFISNGTIIADQTFKAVAYVGLALSVIVPFSLISFSLLPKATNRLIAATVNLLWRLKLVRHMDKVMNKVIHTLQGYQQSLIVLAKSKSTVVFTYVFSILYWLFLGMIPYYVIKSFGVNVSWYDSLTLTMYTYAAISFVPTPGNAGAAEFAFVMIFPFLTKNYMFWVMMLWRLSSYYFSILVGLPIIIYDGMKNHYARNSEENLLPKEETDGDRIIRSE